MRVDCCKREVGTASVEPEQEGGAGRGDYHRRVRPSVVGDRAPSVLVRVEPAKHFAYGWSSDR
jgi:hypothetical protein